VQKVNPASRPTSRQPKKSGLPRSKGGKQKKKTAATDADGQGNEKVGKEVIGLQEQGVRRRGEEKGKKLIASNSRALPNTPQRGGGGGD